VAVSITERHQVESAAMSQGMWGADLDGLRQLAKEMSTASDTLRGIEPLLTPLVTSGMWQGADQQAFEGDWMSRLAPQLISAAEFLATQSDSLRANADAQEAVSNDLGGPGGPFPHPSPFPNPGESDRPPICVPGDGDDDNWLGGLPGWVGDVVDRTGVILGLGGSTLDIVDHFSKFTAPAGVTGAFGALGIISGTVGLFEGVAEMRNGALDDNGWAIGDGAITAALGVGGIGAGTFGIAVATGLVAAGPAGWAVGAGLAVVGGAWWLLQENTPEGMETTEWIAGMASDAWQSSLNVAADVVGVASDVVDAASDAVDATTNFLGDVTKSARDLWPW
jgi:hypothetical protein